jgi:hypothetical protein
VVLNEREPWFHFNDHPALYAPYRFRHDQVVIRDRRGYGRGEYGRPVFEDRGRGRDWGYSRRENNFDRRQNWGRDSHRGGYNNYRHDEGR